MWPKTDRPLGRFERLADAHAGGADVAVVAMRASEKQQGGHYIRNFAEFRDRLVSLGLGTGTWRNRNCDVQAIWSHIHHKRDVFVTSDCNFHKADKKAALIALGAGRIEHPEGALSLSPSHKS
jgi:hypothetical protein